MNSKYECIFLDRDGTINIDPGYISSVKDLKFYDYTFEALRLLKPLTKSFIIITNQSGVNRGIIKEKKLIEINSFIHSKFLENKINLLDIYYCTDLPGNGSTFRKPGVGMFLQASTEYNIDLAKCIMIGDSYKDIVPAKKLGMSSLLVLSGNGKKDLNKFDHSFKPDYIAGDLFLGAKDLTQ
tara:strand:- start:515 stop:1060 length:546 start_codon:yes stop_codon:yes gene_type:complete